MADQEPQTAGRALGMMSKYWNVGEVKTRLAVETGAAAAASIHQQFTLHLTKRIATMGFWCCVFTTPDDRCDNMQTAIGADWLAVAQGNGDLGMRMARALRFLMLGSHPGHGSHAILIGADLPTLTTADIVAAFDQLEDADLVLGPAIDGGYYLIGLRRPWKKAYLRLFESIPWSTNQVFARTMQIVNELGLVCRLLSPREDVDDLQSLLRLLATESIDEELRLSLQAFPQDRPLSCE